MFNRRVVLPLVALGAVAAVNLLSACTPSDDNDSFSTPTPGPTPTPSPIKMCQVVFASQSVADASLLDVVAVDGPADKWLNGSASFQDFTLYYEEEVQLDGHVYVPNAPIAWSGTAGTFDISDMDLNGTSEGAPITAQNFTNVPLEAVVGTSGQVAVVGTSESFDFIGYWSPLDPASSFDIDTGASALLSIGTGATLTISDMGGFGVCYEVPGE